MYSWWRRLARDSVSPTPRRSRSWSQCSSWLGRTLWSARPPGWGICSSRSVLDRLCCCRQRTLPRPNWMRRAGERSRWEGARCHTSSRCSCPGRWSPLWAEESNFTLNCILKARTPPNVLASKSLWVLRALFSLETLVHGYQGSKIVKCLVGTRQALKVFLSYGAGAISAEILNSSE